MNVYYVGRSAAAGETLGRELGAEVRLRYPSAPRENDMVFLDVGAHAGDLPSGNAFVACRELKEHPGVRVWLLSEAGARYVAEIGRFCLADGVLETAADGTPGDLSAVHRAGERQRARGGIDQLLAELEGELASDRGKRASTIQRILAEGREESLIDQLTDPATGLFAGPFAGFKLEEEFKRAMRFHQPLSLVLLDIGSREAEGPVAVDVRDTLLAEVAAVFLNECRDIDVLARFTETTFLFLLPGTGAAGAESVARRMIAELRSRRFGAGASALDPRAGIATVPASGIADRGQLLARAEACLRTARGSTDEAGACVSWE